MTARKIFNRDGICENCGNDYQKYVEIQKYCSENCRILGNRTLKNSCKINYLKCQWCGNDFISRANHAKFCSRKCWHKNNNRKLTIGRLTTEKERKCLFCGKIYRRTAKIKSGYLRFFCSEKCQKLNIRGIKRRYKNKNRKFIARKSKCDVCGREFTKRNEAHRTCSSKCSKDNWCFNLYDSYIAGLLNDAICRYGLKKSDRTEFTKELIGAKREHIKLTRAIKQAREVKLWD